MRATLEGERIRLWKEKYYGRISSRFLPRLGEEGMREKGKNYGGKK